MSLMGKVGHLLIRVPPWACVNTEADETQTVCEWTRAGEPEDVHNLALTESKMGSCLSLRFRKVG